MEGIGLNGYSLKLIGRQHRDLIDRIHKMRNLVTAHIEASKLAEAFIEMRTELGQLRDQMDAHFLLESTGGYMEDAVAHLPRLAKEAEALEHQHSHLMTEVGALVELASESAITPAARAQFAQRVLAFAARMLEHESAETQLLREGFNEDAAVFE